MLDQELRYDFIAKHSYNCTPKQLFDNYSYYYSTYKNGDAHSHESFADCLWYIKKLISKYKPETACKLIRQLCGITLDEMTDEQGYIHFMHEIAHIHKFIHDYEVAVHWAKKTIDMIEYFHPNNSAIDKEYFLLKDECYKECLELYQKYKEYFDEEIYKDFTFDWEIEFYSPTFHANDNGLKAL